MDRRSFNKLLAGAVGTVGVPTAIAADQSSIPHRSNSAEVSVTLETSPAGGGTDWALVILDAVPPPHSLSAADLDGDGELEVIVGEHDPFKPYRSQSRLYAYKKADQHGITWSRIPIDNRFEHHDGAKVVELIPGRPVILSHSWMEPSYVHLWHKEG
jgi:hypothetical protein